ncbi:hypothetical protein SLS54_009587 [Diplodia seriata]
MKTDVRKARPATSDRRNGDANRQCIRDGMALVIGPPGNGKSRTDAAIAVTAALLGEKVKIVAPTDGASKSFLESVYKLAVRYNMLGDTVNICRLNIGMVEKSILESRDDQDFEPSGIDTIDANQAMLLFGSNRLSTSTQRNSLSFRFSLAQTALRWARDNRDEDMASRFLLLRGQCIQTDPEAGSSRKEKGELRDLFHQVVDRALTDTNILICTPEGANSTHLKLYSTTFLINEEAGTTSVPHFLRGITDADKIKTEFVEQALYKTVFHSAYQCEDEELVNGLMDSMRRGPYRQALAMRQSKVLFFTVNFTSQRTPGQTSLVNPGSQARVMHYPSEYALVSAYAEDRNSWGRMWEAIIDRIGAPMNLRGLRMKTIDGYQGQEKPIVMYHMVKSSNRMSSATFVGNANRLTTAITRRKAQLIIFGDLDFLEREAHSKESFANYEKLELLRKYLDCLKGKNAVVEWRSGSSMQDLFNDQVPLAQ